jgi:hypothetical protein
VAGFRTVRDAKEYLIGRIVSEADKDEVGLSEIERKMLYFSETGWTLPGISEVNAEFERDYNDAEYEEKIARLIRRLCESRDEAAQRDWDDAVATLRTEDHYLLVMIDAAAPRPASSRRPPGDFHRLIFTAAVMVVVFFGVMLYLNSAAIDQSLTPYLTAAFSLAVLGTLLYFKVVRWK